MKKGQAWCLPLFSCLVFARADVRIRKNPLRSRSGFSFESGAGGRGSGRHHPGHLIHQLAQVEGFGQDLGVGRCAGSGVQGHCGKTRDKHDLQ